METVDASTAYLRLAKYLPRFWRERKLRLYSDVFKTHPYPVLLCDGQAMCIVDANDKALALYGSLDSIKNSKLEDWLPPGLYAQLARGERPEQARFDTQHRLRTGREFPVRLNVLGLTEEPRYFGLLCMDRAEPARLERLLRGNAEQLRSFIETLPLPAWLEGFDGTPITRNERFRKLPVCQMQSSMTCCTEDWRGAVGCGLVGLSGDSFIQQLRARVVASGTVATHRVNLGSCGSWLFVLFPVAPAGEEHQAMVGGMAVEVDAVHRERARADAVEGQMRSLATSLQAAREEERRAVSRAIHDEMGQEITALQMTLARLRSGLRGVSPGIWEPTMDTVDEIVLNIVDEARRIMVNLRPELVFRDGVVAASSVLVTDMRQRLGIRGTFQAIPAGNWEVEPDLALHIYRSLQSLIVNVARHAKAGRFDVVLEDTGTGYRLSVSDDGVGIGSALPGPKQLGLRGLRERAALHQGTVSIRTRPEVEGTVVTLFLQKVQEGRCAGQAVD